MRRLFSPAWFGLAIAVLVGSVRAGSAQTWIQWDAAAGGNNHYYALTSTATNWEAAQEQAIAWGGTLATITSSNEQNFINNTFLTGKLEHLPLWIGLRKPAAKRALSGHLGALQVQIALHPKADFHWVTGETLSYTNWKSGEPSDTPPGEDYVVINWEYSDSPPRGLKGDWNDTPLNGTTGYGGQTDGPYFGLVEREVDPNQASKRGLYPWAASLAVLILLAAGVVIGFARGRKTQKQERRGCD